MNDDNQVQLPEGYADAKPVTNVKQASQVKLPAGYEDAKPVQVTKSAQAAKSSQVTLPAGYEDAKPARQSQSADDVTPAQPFNNLIDTVKGVVGHIYHSLLDAPTEEEKAHYSQVEKQRGEAPGTETSGLKRIGLGVGRLFGGEDDSTGERYKQGLIKGAGNLLNTGIEAGKDVLSYATSPKPLLISDDKHGESLFHKYITAPAEAEKSKSVTAPTALESIGHSVAEAIPLIGPIAASLGEKAGTGDVAGAAGEATTYAVAPKVIEEAPKVLKRLPIIRDIGPALAKAAEERKAASKAEAHRAVTDELVKQAIDKPQLFPGMNNSPIRIPDIEGAVEKAGKIERNPIAYPLG